MTNDEGLRLALYAKVMLNEDFFESAHNLELDEITDRQVTWGLGPIDNQQIYFQRNLLDFINLWIERGAFIGIARVDCWGEGPPSAYQYSYLHYQRCLF